jgi:outer membrane lipoprotein-sorting protein
MKRSLLLLLVVLIGAGSLAPRAARADAPPTAREIMEKVTMARKLDGSEAQVKMTTIDDKGQTREREITMATKLYDGGKTEKRIYRFLSPADVQGTSVLVFDYETKADDVWIYLPALRKTRRIVSSQRSQSFMGSEFSYGDLNIPAIDDFDYTLVKQEPFGGETCYVIDVAPRSKEVAEGEGYSKKTYWVSKDKFAVMRGLFYDKDGKLLKELVTGNIKLLDAKNKRYRPLHMEMINKQNGRRSVFESKKVTFAPNTKDEYFTTTYLERS